MQNGRIFFSMCKNYNKITSFFCLCRIYSLSLHSHMKKWPSVIRQSLSTKLSLWLVAFVAVMLVAALFVMFMYARRAVKAEALAKSEAALDGMMQSIDNKLHEVEVAANNIHWRVEGAIDNPAALQQLTRKMLEENTSVVGCAIALDPIAWQGNGNQTMFCSYRGQDSIRVSDRFGDKPYTEQDWYVRPMVSCQREWSDPTIEPLRGGYPILGYSIPIRQNNRVVGIFVTAISLEWLSRMVEAARPFPSTHCALLTKDGDFIVHPDSTRLHSGNIYKQLAYHHDEASQQLMESMLKGESGYMSVSIYGTDCYVFYKPYRNTGWSIDIVSPKSEVFATYNRLQSFVVVIMVVSLLLLLLYCFQVIHWLMKPIRYLDLSAQRLASGRFDEPIADSLRHDEIGGLQRSFRLMQCSLANYLSEIRQHSEVLKNQTKALKKARDKAREADRLKSVFVHNTTDQLVEPVNAIASAVSVIQENSNNLDQIDVVQLTTGIADNTKKVTSLLDKIIEVSVNRTTAENETTESNS